ncbi:MAG: hypothetical protein CYPHOPRED_004254 [Cyphobasidiales sp. Tagirdzhanova-0007]|nr:MAG: hypothetical protein CYPHOPRED_004254 [Cyphobasidiales sp. Tagirdzhanova-0007]
MLDISSTSAIAPLPFPSMRQIHFCEFCSLIPGTDGPAPAASSSSAPSVKIPHLGSRVCSVPLPTSISLIFARDAIPEDFKEDPKFSSDAGPRLNFKLPTLTRRKRSTSDSPCPNPRGCLKSDKGQQLRPRSSSTSSSVGDIYRPALASRSISALSASTSRLPS